MRVAAQRERDTALRERRPERGIVRERHDRRPVRRVRERALDVRRGAALSATATSRIARAGKHERRIASTDDVCLVEQQPRRTRPSAADARPNPSQRRRRGSRRS